MGTRRALRAMRATAAAAGGPYRNFIRRPLDFDPILCFRSCASLVEGRQPVTSGGWSGPGWRGRRYGLRARGRYPGNRIGRAAPAGGARHPALGRPRGSARRVLRPGRQELAETGRECPREARPEDRNRRSGAPGGERPSPRSQHASPGVRGSPSTGPIWCAVRRSTPLTLRGEEREGRRPRRLANKPGGGALAFSDDGGRMKVRRVMVRNVNPSLRRQRHVSSSSPCGEGGKEWRPMR